MPAAVPIALAVMAATTVLGAVESNQQTQHAKGAAQAEQTAMNSQITAANTQTAANQKAQSDSATSTQSAAIAALKASMNANAGAGGSILTSPTGAAPAPTQGKQLLGV